MDFGPDSIDLAAYHVGLKFIAGEFNVIAQARDPGDEIADVPNAFSRRISNAAVVHGLIKFLQSHQRSMFERNGPLLLHRENSTYEFTSVSLINSGRTRILMIRTPDVFCAYWLPVEDVLGHAFAYRNAGGQSVMLSYSDTEKIIELILDASKDDARTLAHIRLKANQERGKSVGRQLCTYRVAMKWTRILR
jgi:hypothetical protein